MKICFIGTYEKDYSRNQMIFNGLGDLNVKFEEVHVNLKSKRLHSKNHISIIPVAYRILRKLKLAPVILLNLKKILSSDILFVAYPGHLDLPVGYLIAKLTGKPLIFDPLISLYYTFTQDFGISKVSSIFAKFTLIYERLIFRAPDILLTHTELEKRFFNQKFNVPLKKIRVLYLGANDRIYYYPKIRTAKNKINVVFYGLYNPMHGVKYIVEAARILKNNKDIRFQFIGDGQTFEQNYKLAKKYNLNNITFYKDLTEKDSMGLLRKADIFLGLFKKNDAARRAIPNKVVQGAALGKVVITQDGEAPKTVFNHKKDIYFCKPESGRSLANAILIIQKDVELRKKISLNASKLYRDNFTPKIIGNELLKICKDLL